MKYKLFLFFLFVLLTANLIPASAQEPNCDIDISKALILLGQAQSELATGNKGGALQRLSEARAELQRLEAACGTGTGQVGPVVTLAAPEKREGRIILFSYDRGEEQLNQLDGLAFVNGINLDIYTRIDPFLDELKKPDVIGVIYPSYPWDEVLTGLSEFVKSGGRLIVFYTREWTSNREMVQELFNLAVIDETVYEADDRLLYSETVIPSWLAGLTVGVEANRSMEFNAYLMTPLSGGETLYLNSANGGRQRLMYFGMPDRSLTFMPKIAYGDRSFYFYEDDYIEQFDNEAASLAMLEFLLGTR